MFNFLINLQCLAVSSYVFLYCVMPIFVFILSLFSELTFDVLNRCCLLDTCLQVAYDLFTRDQFAASLLINSSFLLNIIVDFKMNFRFSKLVCQWTSLNSASQRCNQLYKRKGLSLSLSFSPSGEVSLPWQTDWKRKGLSLPVSFSLSFSLFPLSLSLWGNFPGKRIA